MTTFDCAAISLADSEAFARLSGDRNPIHIDPHVARRLLYGQTVVHGVHLALHALDQTMTSMESVESPHRIKARFHAPLFHDASTVATVTSGASKKRHLSIRTKDRELASLDIESTQPGEATQQILPATRPNELISPITLDESALSNANGSIELGLDRDTHQKLLPRLAESRQWDGIVSLLLGATYVVGMLCPGMHSLLAGFDIATHGGHSAPNPTNSLSYRVKRFDPRYRMVDIEIEAGPWSGSVNAFIRPTPAMQPSYDIVCSRADTDDWTGRHALIVGGSRGLGEIAAKIVCAAGGHVTLTFQQGEDDAQRVLDEINSGGGKIGCLRLDVTGDLSADLSALKGDPLTDILYFASPHIDINSDGKFDWTLFDSYLAVYAQPLAPLLAVLADRMAADGAKLFWPSSTFIDQPVRGFAEYAAAKSAGETICRSLELSHPNLTVATPRLPRMRTDQTLSIMPIETAEPLDILIEMLLDSYGAHPNARSHVG